MIIIINKRSLSRLSTIYHNSNNNNFDNNNNKIIKLRTHERGQVHRCDDGEKTHRFPAGRRLPGQAWRLCGSWLKGLFSLPFVSGMEHYRTRTTELWVGPYPEERACLLVALVWLLVQKVAPPMQPCLKHLTVSLFDQFMNKSVNSILNELHCTLKANSVHW